jgi:hypothetical protein
LARNMSDFSSSKLSVTAELGVLAISSRQPH